MTLWDQGKSDARIDVKAERTLSTNSLARFRVENVRKLNAWCVLYNTVFFKRHQHMRLVPPHTTSNIVPAPRTIHDDT